MADAPDTADWDGMMALDFDDQASDFEGAVDQWYAVAALERKRTATLALERERGLCRRRLGCAGAARLMLRGCLGTASAGRRGSKSRYV